MTFAPTLAPEGPVQLGELVPKSFSGDGRMLPSIIGLKWSPRGVCNLIVGSSDVLLWDLFFPEAFSWDIKTSTALGEGFSRAC